MADKDNASRVWAIVLTYGGAEEITAACIDSLLAQDYSALTILLVDNASFDGSGGRLRERYPAIRYLNTGANHGYTGGNNRGMQLAMASGADYLLVLNNDTVLQRDCVSQLMAWASRVDRLGAMSPKILFHQDPRRIWFAGGDFSVARALGTHRHARELDDPNEAARIDDVSFLSGCCMLLPAHVVRTVGGFREDFFMYCEDVELSLRLRRAGYRLCYQPAARMLHRDEMKRELTPASAAMHRDRNRRRIVREYYSAGERALFALRFYPTRAIRFLQYLARGDIKGAGAIAAGAVAR